jgi:hypothetical protein
MALRDDARRRPVRNKIVTSLLNNFSACRHAAGTLGATRENDNKTTDGEGGKPMRRYLWPVLLGASCVPSAWALPPSPAPQIELYLSGSTAQDEAIENLLRLTAGVRGAPNLCQPQTLDVYRGTIGGVEKRAYYCRTADNVPGVPSGLRLVIHKSSGGSGEGVTPVSAGTPIPYIDLAHLPAAVTCRTARPARGSADFAPYSNHTGCDGGGKLAVPRAGLADVNPELVGGVTHPLTVRAQTQIVWGLAVSKNLRNALQAIQGLIPNTIPHDDPSRDTEDAMPTLARTQIAGIFSGALKSWDQFFDSRGSPLTRSTFLAPGAPRDPDAAGASPGGYAPDPATGGAIYICRRISSSGTQAAYETHYLRARCESNAPQFVAPNDGSNLRTGGDPRVLVRVARPRGNVFAGVGTGDVRDCLDAHNHFNRWAVGLLSTENVGNNGNREFRYIKVDGAAPTLLNAATGRWSHVTEQSMQWRNSFDAALRTTNEGRVLAFVAEHMGLPHVIAALNTGFMHSWGQGGYLAPPSSGFAPPRPPITAEALASNPVGGLSLSLGRLNNCAAPVLVGPAQE